MWLTAIDSWKSRLIQTGIAVTVALILAVVPVATYTATSDWFIVGPVIGGVAVMGIWLAALALGYAIASLAIPAVVLRVLVALFFLWPLIYVGDRIPHILADRDVRVAQGMSAKPPLEIVAGGRLAVSGNAEELVSLRTPYTSLVGDCANDWCWGTRSVSAPGRGHSAGVWQENIKKVIEERDLVPSPEEVGLPLLTVNVDRHGLTWTLRLELRDPSGKVVATREHFYRDGFPGETALGDDVRSARSFATYFEYLWRSSRIMTFRPRAISTSTEPLRGFLAQNIRVKQPAFNNDPAFARAQYTGLGAEHLVSVEVVSSTRRTGRADDNWPFGKEECWNLLDIRQSGNGLAAMKTIAFRKDSSGERRIRIQNDGLFCSTDTIWMASMDERGIAQVARLSPSGQFQETISIDARSLSLGDRAWIKNTWQCSGRCRMNIYKEAQDLVLAFTPPMDGQAHSETAPVIAELRISGLELQQRLPSGASARSPIR